MSTLLVADIGGTTVKVGFVQGGIPQGFVRLFPTSDLRCKQPVIRIAEMFRTAIQEAGIEPDAIVSTVPGFLDVTRKGVLYAANVPELNGCSLARELQAAMAMPVTLERDSILALRGEHKAGGCRGEQSVLGVFFGTGVGAAYLEEGKPLRGSGWALEIGHLPYRGARRWLGDERGDCLEAYVSGKVLEKIADFHHLPVTDIFTASPRDGALREDVSEFIQNQANAVATAIAILSPATVLLGGGICEMPDFPKQELVATIERGFPFEHIGSRLALRWASLGWKSVLYGAAI